VSALKIVASGRLISVHVCPTCGALVVDAVAHRAWHEARR
jgi:predicted RNA-binding Zn-ribbon protein involved in translation (DUF1610 family)